MLKMNLGLLALQQRNFQSGGLQSLEIKHSGENFAHTSYCRQCSSSLANDAHPHGSRSLGDDFSFPNSFLHRDLPLFLVPCSHFPCASAPYRRVKWHCTPDCLPLTHLLSKGLASLVVQSS